MKVTFASYIDQYSAINFLKVQANNFRSDYEIIAEAKQFAIGMIHAIAKSDMFAIIVCFYNF